jgi:hypothetical protein
VKQSNFNPTFVEAVPEVLEKGRLYISTRFRTASHLCACGCGSKVVTPIKPRKWRFTYDGETVSLAPSIGRWQLPCRSHYWIRNNKVVWSRKFSPEEIETVMRRDTEDLRNYYQDRARLSSSTNSKSRKQSGKKKKTPASPKKRKSG